MWVIKFAIWSTVISVLIYGSWYVVTYIKKLFASAKNQALIVGNLEIERDKYKERAIIAEGMVEDFKREKRKKHREFQFDDFRINFFNRDLHQEKYELLMAKYALDNYDLDDKERNYCKGLEKEILDRVKKDNLEYIKYKVLGTMPSVKK